MFIDRGAAFDPRQGPAAGLAPHVHAELAPLGIEINDVIADRRPTAHGDFASRDRDRDRDRDRRAAAIPAHRRMPAPGLTGTLFGMIDEHHARMRHPGSPEPRGAAGIALNGRRARAASRLDLGPGVHDPMPGRFMMGADGSILLIGDG